MLVLFNIEFYNRFSKLILYYPYINAPFRVYHLTWIPIAQRVIELTFDPPLQSESTLCDPAIHRLKLLPSIPQLLPSTKPTTVLPLQCRSTLNTSTAMWSAGGRLTSSKFSNQPEHFPNRPQHLQQIFDRVRRPT